MAKQSKTLIEKAKDKVNDFIHPSEQAAKDEAEKLASEAAQKAADEAAKKSDDESDELAKKSKPKSAYKSEMGKHKKFSKFN